MPKGIIWVGGGLGGAQNDRAPRHYIVQVCFSISIQVTKPGMSLSNFIPGPQGTVLSLTSDVPPLLGHLPSYFLLLLQCHFLCEVLPQAPGRVRCSFPSFFWTLSHFSEHSMSLHSHGCRRVNTPTHPSQYLMESRPASQPRLAIGFTASTLNQGSLRVAGHMKGVTGIPSSTCGPIPR